MFIFLVFSFFSHSGELKVNKLKIETSILTGIYQEVIVTGGKMAEKCICTRFLNLNECIYALNGRNK